MASFSFDAPEASGKHTITATCSQCSNSPKTTEINVKVDGLETIPAEPSFYTFVGKTNEHSDNHYLTPEAASVLWRMAASYTIEAKFGQFKKIRRGKRNPNGTLLSYTPDRKSVV